ncbi:MAG: ribose-phosphate pyrophosphokinase [Candidatus Peregrinibacteria bacterium]
MSVAKYKIFAGSSHPKLAMEIAKHLKKPLGKISLSTFSCGEKYIVLEETVRGHTAFIVQTCTDQNVNEDYMELFLMCDAMKRSFASKVHVILPYFGYSRQDKVHIPREPISAKVIADLLIAAGADHVVTLQLHADQEQAFFDVPVDNLSIKKLFAEYFKTKKLTNVVVVSPDAGGAKNAKGFADQLNAPFAIIHKARPSHNVSQITHVVGDVKDKTCIIYDDMVDTGGSVINAKTALLKAGAKKDVYLCATHPIFSGKAPTNLKKAKFKEVVVSNSMPISAKKKFKGLKVISVAPLLAGVIESVTHQKSVSSLVY